MSTSNNKSKTMQGKLSSMAVKRLAMKGGISSISKPGVEYAKEFIVKVTKEIVRNAVIHSDGMRTQTITLECALASIPFKILGDALPKTTCKKPKARRLAAKMRYFMSRSECAMIPVGGFKKMIKTAMHNDRKRLSSDAAAAIQFAVENLAVVMFMKARKIAHHSKRTVVKTKNMKLVKNLNNIKVM